MNADQDTIDALVVMLENADLVSDHPTVSEVLSAIKALIAERDQLRALLNADASDRLKRLQELIKYGRHATTSS